MESKESSGKEGVITQMPARDSRGRLLPGSRLIPKNPGRKPVAYQREVIQALADAFPPDIIIKHYQTALKIAEEQKSARGIANIMSLVTDRIAGKPVQSMSINESGISDSLAAILADDTPLIESSQVDEAADEAQNITVNNAR